MLEAAPWLSSTLHLSLAPAHPELGREVTAALGSSTPRSGAAEPVPFSPASPKPQLSSSSARALRGQGGVYLVCLMQVL